jgi:hypothetical protein
MNEKLRVLIVYESMFGNTEQIAEAIADGLRATADVTLARVDQAPATLPEDLDLLVVGGPTHAFSMSRPGTRDSASAQGHVVMPVELGIREWLDRLQPGPQRAPVVATFDTRAGKVRRLPGSAAKAADKVLRRHHFEHLGQPASFFVEDSAGPLTGGELERARAWGEDLAGRLAPVARSSSDAPGERRAK